MKGINIWLCTRFLLFVIKKKYYHYMWRFIRTVKNMLLYVFNGICAVKFKIRNARSALISDNISEIRFPKNYVKLHVFLNPKSIGVKSWYSDGHSEIGAHVRSNLCYLTCIRLLISSQSSHNWNIFIRKDLFFFMRAQDVISYHLM